MTGGFGNGGYGNIRQRWISRHDVHLGVYYDEKKQEHWKTLMEKLFVPVNPYTGMSILDDPALAGLILVNEGGLAFTNRIHIGLDVVAPLYATKTEFGQRFRDMVEAEGVPAAVRWRAAQFRE